MIHFRKNLNLQEVPEQFIVHLSGDNRYRIYVNGREVTYGPQLGDVRHWRYETLDLAPYLRKGDNLVAAQVMNWGVERAHGILSHKTAFLLQGHSPKEQVLNTHSDSDWKVFWNRALFEKPVRWRQGEIIGGFYASNPTDSIVGANYPWGWTDSSFSDSNWVPAVEVFSRPKTSAGYGHGWILQPRTTAIQTNSRESIGKIVRSNTPKLETEAFGKQPLVIPAHSKRTLLIDKGKVTVGFPKLILSKGKDAQIRITYSEALYDTKNKKGHRDEISGKRIEGISDVYIPDGGDNRVYQPIWFRAFRFIQLDMQTESQPLEINDYHNIYSATDFPVKAKFTVKNPLYQKVWDICWHGMKLCAQDNLMSDVYYETMQYVGDLRPHLMGWTSLTGDLSYFRSALEQFNNSRLPDGNITSCYPLKATFVHPTYSLIWIDMLHDLMMREGDKKWIGQYVGEIQEVFDFYESTINENGLVGDAGYQMFIDWYVPKGGNSKVNKRGNSAILTLNYAYTLNHAARILEWLGHGEKAEHYRIQSRKYAEIVRKLCFDTQKGIYADDPEKTFYDQRASILAVLTDAHSPEEKKDLMAKVLDQATHFDSEANLFYYFYLFEAMRKTGVGNFTEQLEPWKAIVEKGMSATPEKRIEQDPRSEVHPWTAHPVHFYFNVVAGIRPTLPGYATVEIAPMPGELPHLQASYPTKLGMMEMSLEFNPSGRVTGTIILPEGMTGQFKWKGKTRPLTSGENLL